MITSRESYLRSSSNPTQSFMATMRNGSCPSMTMCEFEEIGMKTMQGSVYGNQRPNGLVQNPPLHDDLYQISARNRLNRAGRPQQSPATPLVKMRTNANESAISYGDDSLSSRVQMYGTRVVYSDKDSNTSAGIISNGKHATLGMTGSKPNFAGIVKKAPEAAV